MSGLDRTHGCVRCRRIRCCGRWGGFWVLWNVKRLRGSKNKVIKRLSAEMGRFINLRKRGKPGKKASITVRDRYRPVQGDVSKVGVGRRSRWQDKGGD